MRQTALEINLCRPIIAAISSYDSRAFSDAAIPQRSFNSSYSESPVVRSAPQQQSRFGRSIARLEKCRSAHVVLHIRIRQAQDRLQPGAAFGQMLPHVPESKQRHTEPQAPVEVVTLKEVIESRAELSSRDRIACSHAARSSGLSSGLPSSASTRQYAACARRVAASSSQETRRSSAYSRIVSNILKRVSGRVGRCAGPGSYRPMRSGRRINRFPRSLRCCRRLRQPPTCSRQ